MVAKTLHWKISKEYNMLCSEKLYNHTPEKLVESDRPKILWDYDVRTDHRIQARTAGLILVNKENQKVAVIDIAIPWDTRVVEKSTVEKK